MDAPNVGNYLLGKGIPKWMALGEVSFRDLGNSSQMELTPSATRLDHMNQRGGVRRKDLTVILDQSMTIRLRLDEVNSANLAMYLMGTLTLGTPDTIEIMSLSEVRGALRFIGTNAFGIKGQWDLPSVSLIPGAALGVIGDTWAEIELNGEVLFSEIAGNFGTWRGPITAEIP